MPLEHLNVVFGEISRSTADFLIGLFVLILRHMSCLYILETNPLSVTYFANIFSHIELSFCFAYGLFAVQKLLSIIRSHLSIFGFISFILGDRSKKYHSSLYHRVFCLHFPLAVLKCLLSHLGL